MIGNIVAIFVMILVAVVIFPTISESVEFAQNMSYSTNSTQDSLESSILGITPLFFVLTIVLAIILLLWQSSRPISPGGIETDDEDEEEDDEEYEEDERPRKSKSTHVEEVIVNKREVKPEFDEKYFTRSRYG